MALTASLGSSFRSKFGSIQTYTAGAQIYFGATVALRLTDGLAYPSIEDTSDTYKQIIIGFATEDAAAAAAIRVRRDGKISRPFAGSLSVGSLACVKDDLYVQQYGVATGKVVVGRVVEISGTDAWVDLTDRPARLATSLYE